MSNSLCPAPFLRTTWAVDLVLSCTTLTASFTIAPPTHRSEFQRRCLRCSGVQPRQHCRGVVRLRECVPRSSRTQRELMAAEGKRCKSGLHLRWKNLVILSCGIFDDSRMSLSYFPFRAHRLTTAFDTMSLRLVRNFRHALDATLTQALTLLNSLRTIQNYVWNRSEKFAIFLDTCRRVPKKCEIDIVL